MTDGVIVFGYEHKIDDDQMNKIIKQVAFGNGIIKKITDIRTDNFFMVTMYFIEGENVNTAEFVAKDFMARVKMLSPNCVLEATELQKPVKQRLNTTDLAEVFKE